MLTPEPTGSATASPWSEFSNSLTPLEISCGLVTGRQSGVEPLSRSPKDVSARSALEDAIRPALARSPCLVSFSGGRDSSAILAMAARLARREGLPLPIPATIRFKNAKLTDEASWQEEVIRHVDLTDWVRIELDDELDVVGPIATGILRQLGLLWPHNSFFHHPIFESAAGGSTLTGIGGDEIFSAYWPFGVAASLATGKLPPTRGRIKKLGLYLAFGALPRSVARRFHRKGFDLPWLRPEPRRTFVSAMEDWYLRAPFRFNACLRTWWWPSRNLQVTRESCTRLAQLSNVSVVSPLAEPGVLAALASERGWRGFSKRTDAMHYLFGDWLPENIVTRRTKANFDEAFVTHHTRDFVNAWSGEGIDGSLVDPDELRASWSAEEPDARSLLLLQAAWLASNPAREPAERTDVRESRD